MSSCAHAYNFTISLDYVSIFTLPPGWGNPTNLYTCQFKNFRLISAITAASRFGRCLFKIILSLVFSFRSFACSIGYSLLIGLVITCFHWKGNFPINTLAPRTLLSLLSITSSTRPKRQC